VWLPLLLGSFGIRILAGNRLVWLGSFVFFSVPLLSCWDSILHYYYFYSIKGLFSPNVLRLFAPVIPICISHVHTQPTEDRVRLCSGMYFYSWTYHNTAKATSVCLLSSYASITIVAVLVSEDGAKRKYRIFLSKSSVIFFICSGVCKTLSCKHINYK
jgi:hypothetical protein